MPKVDDKGKQAHKPTPAAPASSSERDYGEWSSKVTLLSSTLCLAVPLWIERLRQRPWEHIQKRAEECCDVVGFQGNLLMSRGKKQGESAEVFNRLAEAIACLSFCPGGVKVFGSHWEACLESEVPDRASVTLSKLCQVIASKLGESNAKDKR